MFYPETRTHAYLTFAGQRFAVSRDAEGRCFIGDEAVGAWVERMRLLGRHDILRDAARRGVQETTATAWSQHRAREREAGR